MVCHIGGVNRLQIDVFKNLMCYDVCQGVELEICGELQTF